VKDPGTKTAGQWDQGPISRLRPNAQS
jgi:hypothetical protein